jgi:hypothetical protein
VRDKNNLQDILKGFGRPLKWVRLPIEKVTKLTKGLIYAKRTHDKVRKDKGIKRGPNKRRANLKTPYNPADDEGEAQMNFDDIFPPPAPKVKKPRAKMVVPPRTMATRRSGNRR